MGRSYIKKKLDVNNSGLKEKKKVIVQGEITSPDAPWLNEK